MREKIERKMEKGGEIKYKIEERYRGRGRY